MRERVARTYGFLKTTAIGGLIFLLPLMVIGALLGYVYNLVLMVYVPLQEVLQVESAFGFVLLFLLAIAILLVLCFFAGLAAQRALARQAMPCACANQRLGFSGQGQNDELTLRFARLLRQRHGVYSPE